MPEIILDSSAVLARIFDEPGTHQITDDLLSRSMIGAVNLAEVQSVLVRRGWNPDEAWEDATGSVYAIAPFTAEQARLAGSLIQFTRSLGLSLGDRACLALGIILKAPVYTADQAWGSLAVGCEVRVIR